MEMINQGPSLGTTCKNSIRDTLFDNGRDSLPIYYLIFTHSLCMENEWISFARTLRLILIT